MGRAFQLTQIVALDALYFSGAWRVLAPAFGGLGAILALNRVLPPWCNPLWAYRERAVDESYIDGVITYLRRRNIDIVSPDEVSRRLTEHDFRRRFVCLTLDGAYRDQYDTAWPVFRKHEAPFTLFVPASFPDGLADLWWLAVAAVVAKNMSVKMVMDGREQRVDAVTSGDKRHLYDGLMRWLLDRERDEDIIEFVRDLGARYDVDMVEMRNRLCMTWSQIAELAKSPLVTIGAQSVSHPVLTKVSIERLDRELRMGRSVIESAIGIAPNHFAYPFGHRKMAGPREFQAARAAGYATAMTLQPGVLHSSHAREFMALPRLSLGGEAQRLRRLKAIMSGVPSALGALFERS